jgi:hypothetical protein
MVQEGVSPIVFDNWRKETFAHILDSKAGSLLAGSFLAYERGHADFLILANPECPEDMVAISPLTTFLGAKFNVPLSKEQVYRYVGAWAAAGRQAVYQWPAIAGQPQTNPVAVSATDPCRAVRPRETSSADTQDSRRKEFRAHTRSVQSAIAILQSNMTEALRQELETSGDYCNAVTSGDLLAMLAEVEKRVICGNRMKEEVVSAALRNVTNPQESGHQQGQAETDEAYISRFRGLVSAAHKVRLMNGTALSEAGCISGFLAGLRPEFDTPKLPWQSNVDQFDSLETVIKLVKSTSQSMLKNLKNSNASRSPQQSYAQTSSSTEQAKRKVDFAAESDTNEKRRSRPFRNFMRQNPSASLYPARSVLAITEDDYDCEDDEHLAASQINEMIRNAIAEHSVFATQGAHGQAGGMYGQPQYQIQQQYPTAAVPTAAVPTAAVQQPMILPPFMHNPQIFLAGQGLARSERPCNYFSRGLLCPYGNTCRYAHAAPLPAVSPHGPSAVTNSPSSHAGGGSASARGQQRRRPRPESTTHSRRGRATRESDEAT